MSKITN